jgi:hypothetical protein
VLFQAFSYVCPYPYAAVARRVSFSFKGKEVASMGYTQGKTTRPISSTLRVYNIYNYGRIIIRQLFHTRAGGKGVCTRWARWTVAHPKILEKKFLSII